jgi:uncharacterized protein
MTSQRTIAVVTGASSGIGRVYADRLAARGHDLILVARRADRLRALAADLHGRHGIAVEVMPANLTIDADLVRLEHRLAEEPGIAVLVNSAGNGKLGPILAMTDADAADTILLNAVAVSRLSRAALRAFTARKAGTIINIASAAALHALPLNTLYSATKAFVLTLSRGLQQEAAGTDVRVHTVMPALTETEFFDGSGLSLGDFDPALVMPVDEMVDAALAGLDRGEDVTFASLHDAALLERFDAARMALYDAAGSTGTSAPRYRKAA